MTGAFIKSAGLELCSHLKTATENWELPRVYKRHKSVTHPKKMDMDGIGKCWSILVYHFLRWIKSILNCYLTSADSLTSPWWPLFSFSLPPLTSSVNIVVVTQNNNINNCIHYVWSLQDKKKTQGPGSKEHYEVTPWRCIHVDPTRRWRMVDPCCCATALLLQLLLGFLKELGPSHIKWPSLSNFRIPSAAERYTFISSSLVHKDDVGASLVHAQLTLITLFGKLNERIQPNPSKKKDHQTTNNQNMLLESLNMGETLDQDTAHTHFKCHETKLRSWLPSIPQHI